jgi:hypothetical protein
MEISKNTSWASPFKKYSLLRVDTYIVSLEEIEMLCFYQVVSLLLLYENNYT